MRSRARALAVPAALVAALLGGALALRRDPREPNWEPLPADMVRGPAARAQDASPWFPDRMVERHPPAGAVPRGAEALDYGPGDDEAKRAGRELRNPVPDDAAARARGEVVWRRICANCHGTAGRADAPIVLRGFPPPPDLRRPESRALADGEIFHAITFGRKNMPAAALQATPEDRWRAIRWLRTLQEAK